MDLLVPINVEALCVNANLNKARSLPSITQFETLPYDNGSESETAFLGERVMRQPFPSASLAQGVHLHWAMPDALLHGERTAGGVQGGDEPRTPTIRFPKLPDRWLITRTELDGPTVSWVMDSRFVAMEIQDGINIGSSAIPWENRDDQTRPPFRFLGRTMRLEQWQAPSPGSLLAELTAASMGFVQAPAFYPNCRNVFGMHDPAARPAEYAYTVCGWHADVADDPLAGKTAVDTARTLTEFRWVAPSASTFEHVLYVGVVHSVRWNHEETPKQPQPLRAAFGNTTAEASAALHAAVAKRSSRAFPMQMQALLSGQLDRLHEPGGEQRVLRQFHKQRFSPATFGSFWYAAQPDGTDAFATLPMAQRDLLERLNEAERQRTALRDLAQAKQWQLFADWYKYMKCRYPDGDDLPEPDQVRGYMEDHSLLDAEESIDACKAANQGVARLHRELAAALPAGLALTARPQPECWRPVDPVLLLQGADVKPALRFGGDGELVCRVSVLSGLELREGDVAGVGSAKLDAATDLPDLGLGDKALGPRAPLLAAIVFEGRLLWPAWAGAALSVRAGKKESAAQVAAWVGTQDLDATPSPWAGIAPARQSVTAWHGNPWLPIVMHWDLAYEPLQRIEETAAGGSFEPTLVMEHLTESLDGDEVDLVLRPPAASGVEGPRSAHYRGVTFITPQAGERVKEQLKTYAEMHPTSLLAALEPHTGNTHLLSQTLSGFHDRLLLRRQTLQVDVRDPFARGSFEKAFVKRVEAAVMALGSRTNTMAPIVHDAFSPVRGGDFTLTELMLGDVFGQTRSFPFGGTVNEVLTSQALGRNVGGVRKPAFPPRLSQAVRLDFHWLAAEGDRELRGSDPTASPICGWIIPNFLEGSVAIYEGSGDPLGSVIAVRGELVWQGSPARPETFGVPVQELFHGRNPHLRDFTLALLGQRAKGEYLKAYLLTLKQSMMMVQPSQASQHATLPMLAGHPLALTRVSLKLNLIGAPAVNQTWKAFELDMHEAKRSNARQTLQHRTTNGHEAIAFPVVLGVVDDPDDGLVGFYQGKDEGQERFAAFTAVATPRETLPEIHRSRVHSIQLSASEPRRVLAMLVDPRTEVLVTAGYAPSQSVLLPAEAVKAAFATMAVTFLTAPVLTRQAPPVDEHGAVAVPTPLPGQQGGTWKWVRVVAQEDGKRKAVIAGTMLEDFNEGRLPDALYLQEGWLTLGDLDR